MLSHITVLQISAQASNASRVRSSKTSRGFSQMESNSTQTES